MRREKDGGRRESEARVFFGQRRIGFAPEDVGLASTVQIKLVVKLAYGASQTSVLARPSKEKIFRDG